MIESRPVLAVVGVGLIGGSFALALREAGAVSRIIGFDPDRRNLEKALALGLIDSAAAAPEEIAAADVVFLATPVQAMTEAVKALAPYLRDGAIVTDGGSVKKEVITSLLPLLPEPSCFVPGHPIAGTEKSGAQAAFSSLFRNKRCILTPTVVTSDAALTTVQQLWEAAGSEVVVMDAEKHDRVLAAISHLPHMVAYALVNAVGAYDRYNENILLYSAGGFRDFTRIASSDPTMWRDIALTNRAALLEMMDHFETFFAALKEDIRCGDSDKLYEFFLRSKMSRDAIL